MSERYDMRRAISLKATRTAGTKRDTIDIAIITCCLCPIGMDAAIALGKWRVGNAVAAVDSISLLVSGRSEADNSCYFDQFLKIDGIKDL